LAQHQHNHHVTPDQPDHRLSPLTPVQRREGALAPDTGRARPAPRPDCLCPPRSV